MSTLANLTLTYLANSLWQVPLAFSAAWLLSRLVRRNGPTLEHSIWCAALLLAAILPACNFDLRTLWHTLQSLLTHSATDTTGHITITMGTPQAINALHLPAKLLGITLIAYACTLLYFTARLAWGFQQTRSLRASSTPLEDAAILSRWNHYRRLFSVDYAEIAVNNRIRGPITLGITHRLLLLPQPWLAMVAPEDLDAALAHECAHMRRQDFAKNLLYQLLALPIAYHPLLWPILARISGTREMICDALAAEALAVDAIAGRQRYARSLLNLASLLAAGPRNQPRSSSLHAIGIFDAHNFERRVMNLTTKQLELRGLRRLVTTAACVALAAGTTASALAFHRTIATETIAAGPTATQAEAPDHNLSIKGAVLAGNILSKVTPVYPQEAKDKHIGGAVILAATIGKDGSIASLKVVSGPEVLTKSAWEAVKQWRYKPYLLNGEPVAVDTTITVNYSLAN